MKQFLLGSSWNSFKIVNTRLHEDVSPEDILENMVILSQHYAMKLEYIALKELMCIEILLEDLPPTRRQSSSRSNTRGTRRRPTARKRQESNLGGISTRKKQIFKIAVSVGHKILFCNRNISKHFRELFGQVFQADPLEPYDLFGSPPCDLLLLYQQSFKSDENFKAKKKCVNLDKEVESYLFEKETFTSELFPDGSACPRIRNLVLRDIIEALQSTDKSLADLNGIRIGEIKLEVNSKSIFDYYLNLEKWRNGQTFPKWITDCKEEAKTKLNYIPEQ
ncbi:UNVERIFIED_CONTAM: hypothetical protein RMT77_007736 [Armadillidium vulgare]